MKILVDPFKGGKYSPTSTNGHFFTTNGHLFSVYGPYIFFLYFIYLEAST